MSQTSTQLLGKLTHTNISRRLNIRMFETKINPAAIDARHLARKAIRVV